MKKLFSMALIALMVTFATVSCGSDDSNSKNPPVTPQENPDVTDTITKNPIMDAFYAGKDLIGKSHDEVVSALKAKGYYDNGGIIMFVGESYYVQMNDSANEEGKVFNLSLTVTPYNSGMGVYKPMLTMSYAYDAVKKIGSQFNMGSHQLRYWGTYNQVGTRMAANYEEFIKYVNSGNFNQNNSIWIDSTIQHYDATDWNSFIGLQLHSTKYDVAGSDVVEFSFPINFIDNGLKD
ncbi:MAG: hypothetical protein MJ002_00970 [Paludibacteraceae bacterium]|nr:hypothetical protein [Paludibacteraceae bacterium]